MKTLTLLAGMAMLVQGAAAQDFRQNVNRSLFSDQKANRLGDAITILVVESASAVNDAKTSAGRKDDMSFGATLNTGSGSGTDIGATIGAGAQFKGEGATSSRGQIQAKISAQVDSVLANGNLVINGKRSITINGEEQQLRISGIVRPADIRADNSVFSYNIADAVISVQGDGVVSNVQGPGLLTKFLHLLF